MQALKLVDRRADVAATAGQEQPFQDRDGTGEMMIMSNIAKQKFLGCLSLNITVIERGARYGKSVHQQLFPSVVLEKGSKILHQVRLPRTVCFVLDSSP